MKIPHVRFYRRKGILYGKRGAYSRLVKDRFLTVYDTGDRYKNCRASRILDDVTADDPLFVATLAATIKGIIDFWLKDKQAKSVT